MPYKMHKKKIKLTSIVISLQLAWHYKIQKKNQTYIECDMASTAATAGRKSLTATCLFSFFLSTEAWLSPLK
jgi:hypothetical protein